MGGEVPVRKGKLIWQADLQRRGYLMPGGQLTFSIMSQK